MQKQEENSGISVKLQKQQIKGHNDHYRLIVTTSKNRIQNLVNFLPFAFYYLFEQLSDTRT